MGGLWSLAKNVCPVEGQVDQGRWCGCPETKDADTKESLRTTPESRGRRKKKQDKPKKRITMTTCRALGRNVQS